MIKVNTYFILPNSLLKHCIKYFAIRKFDTDGIAFSKVITAEHEMMISFHLHCKVFDFEEFDKKKVPFVVLIVGVLVMSIVLYDIPVGILAIGIIYALSGIVTTLKAKM